MILKYEEFVRESLGINYDLEDQAKIFYNTIKNSKDNKFTFILYIDGTNTFFDIIINNDIDKDKNVKGDFHITEDGSILIRIRNRDDFATLLHEVKHVSRYIKNKKYFDTSIFHKNKDKIEEGNLLREILYVYDIDEFEAKCHSYYIDIKNYVEDHIKSIDVENRTSDKILYLIKSCLINNGDKTYTWYIGWIGQNIETKSKFEFSNYFSKRNLYKIFYTINKNKYNPTMSYLSILKDKYLNIKDTIKTTFFLYSQKELIDISKKIYEFEKEINNRKKVFSKKFYRLFSIIINKYIHTND